MLNILEWIWEPLSYGFLLRGLVAGLLTAMVCSLLSNFVVWQGWSFIGDAISHAILPGVVISYILGISFIWGALAFAVIAVLCIGFIRNNSVLKEDSATGIVYAGFFAFGLLLLNTTRTFQDLGHILFGNILGVNSDDLLLLGLVSLLIAITLGLSFKELLTVSFDPAHASAIGLSPAFIRYLQLILLALTIVIAVQTVGIVLVIAFLITPASTALLLTNSLGKSIVLSVIFALTAMTAGFYISYYANMPSGPVIVLVLIGFFVVALIIRQIRTISRSRKQRLF